jgi:hypothetical protein
MVGGSMPQRRNEDGPGASADLPPAADLASTNRSPNPRPMRGGGLRLVPHPALSGVLA